MNGAESHWNSVEESTLEREVHSPVVVVKRTVKSVCHYKNNANSRVVSLMEEIFGGNRFAIDIFAEFMFAILLLTRLIQEY